MTHDPPRTWHREHILHWSAVLVVLATAVTLFVVQPGSPRSVEHLPAPATVEQTQRILGVYGRPVLQGPTNDLDAAATIDSTRSIDADTYAYPIGPALLGRESPSRAQWEELGDFADAAVRQGVGVLVYLVPPTEAPDPETYEPYGWDYVAWARAIAEVARSHPAIRGVVIDDLGTNVLGRSGNGFTFTADLLVQMRAELAGAGRLPLYGVLYIQDLFGSYAIDPRIVESLDGVVFPYTGRSSAAEPANTSDSRWAASQSTAIGDLLQCRAGVPCSVLDFSPSGVGAPVTARTTVLGSCRAKVPCMLTAEVSDSSWGTDGSTAVEVWADGRRVVRRVVRSPIARQLTFDLAKALEDNGARAVTLRVEPVLDGSSYYRIRVHTLAGSGTGWTPKPAPRWVVPPGVLAPSDNQRQWLFMAYASRLAAEPDHEVSSTYVRQVLAGFTRAWPLSRPTGCLIYLVPRPPGRLDSSSGRVRAEVTEAFRRLRDLRTGS